MKYYFTKRFDMDFDDAVNKIGVMLPCNVIIQQKTDGGKVEISAVDPTVYK